MIGPGGKHRNSIILLHLVSLFESRKALVCPWYFLHSLSTVLPSETQGFVPWESACISGGSVGQLPVGENVVLRNNLFVRIHEGWESGGFG